jgi:hypothetical protein
MNTDRTYLGWTSCVYADADRSYLHGLGWTASCVEVAGMVYADAADDDAAALLADGLAPEGYRDALAASLADHADACDYC